MTVRNISPLRAARVKAGLTARVVAEKIGIKAPALSKIEQGKQQASPEVAEKLAQLLGISELVIFYPDRYRDETEKSSLGLGDRLREERERLGYTQTEFAKIVSASKNAQINWEKGIASPNAVALSTWLLSGLDILYVVTGKRVDTEKVEKS